MEKKHSRAAARGASHGATMRVSLIFSSFLLWTFELLGSTQRLDSDSSNQHSFVFFSSSLLCYQDGTALSPISLSCWQLELE